MVSEVLTTIYSQHTVYLQRVGATQGNAVIPYLEAIEQDVVDILNKYRKRNVTVNLQLKIQEQIDEVARKHLQEYARELKTSNREIGAYEGRFAADTLNGLVKNDDFDSQAPTASAINTAAIIKPVKLGDTSYTSYTAMMRNYWQKWTNEINGIVQAGFTQGQTMPEITKAANV